MKKQLKKLSIGQLICLGLMLATIATNPLTAQYVLTPIVRFIEFSMDYSAYVSGVTAIAVSVYFLYQVRSANKVNIPKKSKD